MNLTRVLTLGLCLPLPLAFAQQRVLKEITVGGTGYERGFQHGRQLEADIAEIVTEWKTSTAASLDRPAEEVLADFFEHAEFTDAIKRWTPDLYDEVRGIAEGSGRDLREILILNLPDEFWVYIDTLEHHHCSGMGVPASDSSPTFVAQNMDLDSFTDGYQVLMRIRAHGQDPEQLVLTHAGLIGLNGMNATGVAVCVNTLMQLKASSRGLPVAFVVRELIRRTKKEDLLSFVQSVEHASGQNYILGIRDEVYDFEASAGRVVRLEPENPRGAVYHTNHPLVNDDVKPWYAADDPTLPVDEQPEPGNSRIRLAAVEKRMAAEGAIDVDRIKATLRSRDDENHPVCRRREGGDSGFTFASVVMTLSDRPSLQIVAGPPDEGEYSQYVFGTVE